MDEQVTRLMTSVRFWAGTVVLRAEAAQDPDTLRFVLEGLQALDRELAVTLDDEV